MLTHEHPLGHPAAQTEEPWPTLAAPMPSSSASSDQMLYQDCR